MNIISSNVGIFSPSGEPISPFDLDRDFGLAGLLSAPDLSKNGNILFYIGDWSLAVEKIENVDSESEGHVLRKAKASKRKFLFNSQIQVQM